MKSNQTGDRAVVFQTIKSCADVWTVLCPANIFQDRFESVLAQLCSSLSLNKDVLKVSWFKAGLVC